jgi:hypothetical protein
MDLKGALEGAFCHKNRKNFLKILIGKKFREVFRQ